MAALLASAAPAAGPSEFLRHLRSSLDPVRTAPLRSPFLVDPLSERELDVLRLLATHLTGPDIARELVVSLNTLRTHTKSIYTKLGVNSRRDAVQRGSELDLLGVARAG